MLETINRELLELKEELREFNKQVSLEQAKSEELEKKMGQRKELEEILDKERKDVEKLESLSVAAVWSTLLGKKDEKIDKEKEEYLLAKLKLEECNNKIQNLEKEIKHLQLDLERFGNPLHKYENLMKEREDVIIEEGGSLGLKLKDSIVKMDELKIDLKEINEAILAGNTALKSLEEVRDHLKNAKSWGTWDLLGGGLLADLAKHSAIEKANSIASEVQNHLNAFKKELSDVNEFTDIQVNLSSFASFADFFLDGIFADWFVQSKINDSLNNVYGTMEKIEEIIFNLEQNRGTLELSYNKEQAESNQILGK